MKVIVASVPGAGKTTILRYVQKKIPEVKIVHEGDLILEIARKEFGIKERDELREKLTIDQQRYVQGVVAEKISKVEDKLVFIDTHLAIKTPQGFFPSLSEKVVDIIKPDLIIFLEFLPEDVIERRMKDPTRHRDVETEEQIDDHQKVSKEFAFAVATHAECPVEIVNLRYKEKEPFEHAIKGSEEIIRLIKR